MSVSLAPSSALGFNSELGSMTLVSPALLIVHPRASYRPRQTNTNRHKQQCATCRIQGQDHGSKGKRW